MDPFLELLGDPVRLTALLARIRADDAALRCLTTVARFASGTDPEPPDDDVDDASVDFDDDAPCDDDLDTFGDADEDELR